MSEAQAVHERMRNYVLKSGSTEGVKPAELPPRGYDGKFIKREEPENVQQTEEGQEPETAPVEAEPATNEAETATEEQQQETPAPRKVKVKIDGAEEEVDEEEVRLGYMRQRDYTKKTQEVARERDELPKRVQAETAKMRDEYTKQVQLMQQLVMTTVAPELLNTDLEQLWLTNPAQAGALHAKGQKVTAAVQRLQAQMAAEQAKAQADTQAEYAVAVRKAQEDLSTIPNWGDDKYHGMLNFAAKQYGFKQDEIGNVVDSRVVRMALDAQAYHDLKAEQAKAVAKPAPKPQPAPAPKVVKPGTRGMNAASEALKNARDNLAKSGRLQDAAAIFKARLVR
jgi:hypothetical protein